eukprot:CAMPEP_0176053914 /NCGR_PEP_ID=MMETSP0120_2-20121206/26821_1 /TAXON_ID=160619 /ORGANISM="Kryptoperidinium foliaceum, Strain CCMP 1326" /LENGTH=282 /DNA_ID=CAMNT_0017387375 /DNA_START=25 /DNA_END=876 /DNA_ORIENTATION=+
MPHEATHPQAPRCALLSWAAQVAGRAMAQRTSSDVKPLVHEDGPGGEQRKGQNNSGGANSNRRRWPPRPFPALRPEMSRNRRQPSAMTARSPGPITTCRARALDRLQRLPRFRRRRWPRREMASGTASPQQPVQEALATWAEDEEPERRAKHTDDGSPKDLPHRVTPKTTRDHGIGSITHANATLRAWRPLQLCPDSICGTLDSESHTRTKTRKLNAKAEWPEGIPHVVRQDAGRCSLNQRFIKLQAAVVDVEQSSQHISRGLRRLKSNKMAAKVQKKGIAE